MNEINKDELLDLKKWQRLFFMVIYGTALYFVAIPLLIFVGIQFLFYLFTSKVNAQLQAANNWLQDFFNDSLNFLSFNTDSKPWPFDKGAAPNAEEEVEVIEGESEEVELDVEQPDKTSS